MSDNLARIKKYRFNQMIYCSRFENKKQPSFKELEVLYETLVDFKCQFCNEKMVWFKNDNSKKVITLQHDHSGKFRFLCLSCNSAHQNYPKDSFYKYYGKKKFCRDCKKFISIKNFYKSKVGHFNIGVYCKKCTDKKSARWFKANRQRRRVYNRNWMRVNVYGLKPEEGFHGFNIRP